MSDVRSKKMCPLRSTADKVVYCEKECAWLLKNNLCSVPYLALMSGESK